jgi:hypothetical protein
LGLDAIEIPEDVRDLEEDELGKNGDDLSSFGAEEKFFRERTLALVAIGEGRR